MHDSIGKPIEIGIINKKPEKKKNSKVYPIKTGNKNLLTLWVGVHHTNLSYVPTYNTYIMLIRILRITTILIITKRYRREKYKIQ